LDCALSGERLKELICGKPPLIEAYIDLDQQLQSNGFDLTLRQIDIMQTSGQITTDNGRRQLSSLSPLIFDGLGFIDLPAGIYSITYNEIVHLPRNVMALATPRSSLLRCGVTVNTAVWDTGYSGRSQSLLVVYNPRGIRLEKNARIVQLVFFALDRETEGYRGTYQGENLGLLDSDSEGLGQ
jgi:dUTP pyrophosphatase